MHADRYGMDQHQLCYSFLRLDEDQRFPQTVSKLVTPNKKQNSTCHFAEVYFSIFLGVPTPLVQIILCMYVYTVYIYIHIYTLYGICSELVDADSIAKSWSIARRAVLQKWRPALPCNARSGSSAGSWAKVGQDRLAK